MSNLRPFPSRSLERTVGYTTQSGRGHAARFARGGRDARASRTPIFLHARSLTGGAERGRRSPEPAAVSTATGPPWRANRWLGCAGNTARVGHPRGNLPPRPVPRPFAPPPMAAARHSTRARFGPRIARWNSDNGPDAAMKGWTLEDAAWERFDAGAVGGNLPAAIEAAALFEHNGRNCETCLHRVDERALRPFPFKRRRRVPAMDRRRGRPGKSIRRRYLCRDPRANP